MKKNTSTAILGAGISGLSIAYALKKRGVDVSVYEKEGQSGGVIQTHRNNGWLVEKGPNTMLVRDQNIWDLLDELELSKEIARPGEAKKRYVVRDGQLHSAPLSILDFLKTNLLSTSAKLRLLKEPFVSASEKDDESIAEFIHRRLGSEPLDYVINPFVSGIYAGDPKRLSVKHTFSSLFEMEQNHGSIAKGFLKRPKTRSAERALISFKDGLHTLPEALADKLGSSIQLSTSVNKITKIATGWSVVTNKAETHHDTIVSTIPVHRLPDIWSDAKSRQSVSQLADIEYVPMSVLALGFKRDQVVHPLDGFGMLIPEKEPFNMLGCLFSSSLFPARTPENHVLLTCFIGGARNPELAKNSTDLLIKKTLSQLNELLGINSRPQFHHHTYWPKGIPQYDIGFDKYLNSMDQIESTNPGFFFGGNYRGGVSVPDCILNGFDTAERIEMYLHN